MLLRARLAVLALLLFGLAACGGGPRPASVPGAPAAQAAVERFLDLAADREYGTMGWVFGTREGPILERDDPAEVEKRMYAIASVLRHDAYQVRGEQPVPGRSAEAVRLQVYLREGAREYLVPFVAVRGPGQRWFVEQVGIEEITGAR